MEDIINQRFGNLVVVSLHEKLKKPNHPGYNYIYKCLCDCGNYSTARRSNLKCGHTKSCGCLVGAAFRNLMEIENNLSGLVFNRLTVIGRDPEDFHKFLCSCECGNTSSVKSYALKSGKTKSCGCLASEKSAETLEAYKQKYRADKGLDPLVPIGKDKNNIERALFRDTIQQDILQRDNFTCVWCSTKNVYLNVHHLDTWKDSPDRRFDKTNLVTLCRPCHKMIHSGGYHRPVDAVMTILLKGYSENLDANMTEYFHVEKVHAARLEVSAT